MNEDALDWFFQDLNTAIDRIPPDVTKDRYFSFLLESMQKIKK